MSLLRRGPRRIPDLPEPRPMDPEARFLWEHQKADHIVYDAETGQVFAAEYTTARGVPRTFPVRFLFGGGAEYI